MNPKKDMDKRRELIKLLKTEQTIDCLTLSAYLTMLKLSIEITAKDPNKHVAKLVRAWEQTS